MFFFPPESASVGERDHTADPAVNTARDGQLALAKALHLHAPS